MFSLPNPPNLVPDFDVTVHVVLDDFGKAGSVYRETDEAEAGLEAVTENLLTGQYNRADPGDCIQYSRRLVT